MAHSPASHAQARQITSGASPFERNLQDLNTMIRNGRSLSGRERNCCFLNTGQQRFAIVSAITGWDFADDGRCPVFVDWDRDGDLDVWVANRTAPQIRFLRNESANHQRSLQLRLVGTRCHQDAIGARVRLTLDDGTQRITSRRAGEGYLGQSSRWLHFGLGTASVDRVEVRWPGATDWESFAGVAGPGRWQLVQGRQQAAPDPVGKPTREAKVGPLPLPPPTEQARVLLADRIPVPPLDLIDAAANSQRFVPGDVPDSHQATLVCLWASWCAPCLQEFQSWKEQAPLLQDVGVRVLAVSLDAVDDQPQDTEDAQAAIARLGFPFEIAFATEPSLATLNMVHEMPFGRELRVTVPTSLLLDGNGKLAAVYRGPVAAEIICDDVRELTATPGETLRRNLPFPGRWHRAPRPPNVVVRAKEFVRRDHAPTAARLLAGHPEPAARHRDHVPVALWLAEQMAAQQQTELARQLWHQVLQVQPDHVAALNNLAWNLAAHPERATRDGAQAVAWAERAAQLTQHANVGILDTLAAAYAEAGRFDQAVATLDQALQLPDLDTPRREALRQTRQRYARQERP